MWRDIYFYSVTYIIIRNARMGHILPSGFQYSQSNSAVVVVGRINALVSVVSNTNKDFRFLAKSASPSGPRLNIRKDVFS